jgi:glycosyltransferase involved in cell wall biosynthesis
VANPPHSEVFQWLQERGLLAAQPEPQRLSAGNIDRRPEQARTSWRAAGPDGTPLKLTLGRNLADLAGRHRAMSAECISLVPPLRFVETAQGNGEVIAEPFFAGRSLHNLIESGPAAVPAVLAALTRVEAGLAATSQPSDESARRAEWDHWAEAVLAMETWLPGERASLRAQVLPRLQAALTASPPVTRWSTGDFTPDNVLVNEDGQMRLIDLEFAARTHFFTEDRVRFPAFSPRIRALLPRSSPSLAWHVFFWLRQFQLESAHNTAVYLARVRPRRLAVIRRLCEQLWNEPLTDWSVAPPGINFQLEENRWAPEQSRALLFGWARSPAETFEGVAVFDGRAEVASSPLRPRPDVAQQFGTTDLNAGFNLAAPLPPSGEELMLAALASDGAVLPFLRVSPTSVVGRALEFADYPAWAARHDPDPISPAPASARSLRFSVLVPVYNPPAEVLRACLQSVLAQHFSNWELQVVDDASTAPHVAPILREFAALDRRIVLRPQSTNRGIAGATNVALEAATGDYIVLLDHDDVLRPHALAELAKRIFAEPTADVLYSDEDKITADGRRLLPFLKPAFSPEFLLGVMYVGHVLCVRTATARAAGGFRSEFDGVQDYEFFLRVSALTRRIVHVPRIIYHWRQSPTSSALQGNVKGDMDARQLAAVQQHLARIGDPRRAISIGSHRLRLLAGADVPQLQLFIASSDGLASGDDAIGLSRDMPPLNALREACARSTAEIVVFLGATPRDWNPAWARELAAVASRPDSGCVAPILLADAGHVLAAGWTVGPGGTAPLLRGVFPGDDGYNGSLACNREVAAVSAHCVAVRRDIAREILERLAPSATWLDFCTAIRAKGLFHRICAGVRVEVGAGARPDLSPTGAVTERDPFFNPHFDPITADYSLTDRPTNAANVLQFYIDQPTTWDPLPRCLIVRGWAYAGGAIKAIRLHAGSLTFTGAAGLPRPDVQLAIPSVADPCPGFEVRAVLPTGSNELRVEVQLPDDQWHVLVQHEGRVARRWRPLWLAGGDWPELMFQMAAHMTHPPRPVQVERFPRGKPASNRPKLSIVTPSYQQARFLKETMASVLNQDLAVEYVVQDGGSTDGSVELIREQAKHLHAWSTGPDGGQAAAIAAGFARTSGGPDDVMAWINSDDTYLPGALVYVADYFARHPDVDAIYGHRIVINDESQEVGRWFLPRHDPAVISLIDFVPQETLFWRRRAWERAGGLNPALKFAMDWDFLLRLQASGASIVRVPYFLACFRVHVSQKTSAAMHHTGQREIDELRKRTHGRDIPSLQLARDPRLLGYLRRSAFIEFLWKLGLRAP